MRTHAQLGWLIDAMGRIRDNQSEVACIDSDKTDHICNHFDAVMDSMKELQARFEPAEETEVDMGINDRGLQNREQFRYDMLSIMREQGIMAMGVAFTIPVEGKKPYADFDTFVNDGGVLDSIDSALDQLKTQFDDEMASRNMDP